METTMGWINTILAIAFGGLAGIGLLTIGIITWEESRYIRHKLKLKLFPKWKAKFVVGEHVLYHDEEDGNIICIVKSVHVCKENNIVSIEYFLYPTVACNKIRKEWLFENTFVYEKDILKLR